MASFFEPNHGDTTSKAVSYTHLDVYKRQAYGHGRHELACIQAMESMVRVAVNLLTVE